MEKNRVISLEQADKLQNSWSRLRMLYHLLCLEKSHGHTVPFGGDIDEEVYSFLAIEMEEAIFDLENALP